MLDITYPVGLTDKQKLAATYRLLEEARLAHNVQGAIAKADWKANSSKWVEYSKKFSGYYETLQYEKACLREAIRKATYTDVEWKKLDIEDMSSIEKSLYGSKEQAKQAPTFATSSNLGLIKALDISKLSSKEVIDPVEDFTTYTEVDPNSHISKTSTRITFTDINQNEDAYVYKDAEVDHFDGDFEHLEAIWIDWTSPTQTSPYMATWVLANILEDYKYIYLNDDGLAILARAILDESALTIHLIETLMGTPYLDTYDVLTQETPYYLKVKRDEAVGTYGTIYCYIYDDTERTNLLDTLVLTLHEKEDYRYIYVTSSWNGSQSGAITGYCENLDLQEAVAAIAVDRSYGAII